MEQPFYWVLTLQEWAFNKYRIWDVFNGVSIYGTFCSNEYIYLELHFTEIIKMHLSEIIAAKFMEYESLYELLRKEITGNDQYIPTETKIVKITLGTQPTVELIGSYKDVLYDLLMPENLLKYNEYFKLLLTDCNLYEWSFPRKLLLKYINLLIDENKKLKATNEELQLTIDYHPDGTKAKELKSHFLDLVNQTTSNYV